MRRLPPLTAIRAFEAAARHQHFTAAAAELGMTQAAVSYQVRSLEERIGTRLFERVRGRVELTDAGKRLLTPLTQAFDRIDAAFALLRAEDESTLSISTTHTFANAWLAWRIGGFQIAHPDIAVRLDTNVRPVDFASDDVDVAIRAGKGDWPGLDAERLIPIESTPMTSPALLAETEARLGRHIAPADIPTLPLISGGDPEWADWLAKAGVAEGAARRRGGIQLDSQASEGNAAIAGQGFALLTPFFWRNDLNEGRLVRPFTTLRAGGFAYWLVYPEERRNTPKIKRFREWLLPLVRADLAAAGQVGLRS